MKHIKHWRVIGEITEEEIQWLYINKFDVQVEGGGIHFTVFAGHRTTMPDVTTINIQSYGNAAETMLCLKFNDRLMLFSEQHQFHGCHVEF